jgi:hypothetical protein
MPSRRIVKREDYPMVIDWSEYKTTHSKLPCKCQCCGKISYKSVHDFDSEWKANKRFGVFRCNLCKPSAKRIINHEDYPMVLDWSGYQNVLTLLPCKCECCGKTFDKTISDIDQQKTCYCKQCSVVKTAHTNIKKYGCKCSFQSENVREKYRKTFIEKYGVDNPMKIKEIVDKLANENLKKLGRKYGFLYNKEVSEKIYQTKLKNHTLNTSKLEENCYKMLCEKYNTSDIHRNYNKDIRYPFHVDFYIVSKDVFVECNFHWSHGKEPFDESFHNDILIKWNEKAKMSKFYRSAIKVWTFRDPLKVKTAKDNNLKYFVFYNIKEFKKWIENDNH